MIIITAVLICRVQEYSGYDEDIYNIPVWRFGVNWCISHNLIIYIFGGFTVQLTPGLSLTRGLQQRPLWLPCHRSLSHRSHIGRPRPPILGRHGGRATLPRWVFWQSLLMISTLLPTWTFHALLPCSGLGIRSFQKNGTIFAFFSALYKRTERSLRSFPFFIKERNNLCILFCSL